MSWINLASTRAYLHQQATAALEGWKTLGQAYGRAMEVGLYALISGDQELLSGVMEMARPVYERYVQTDERSLGRVDILSNLLGLTVLTHLSGLDQTPVWERIVRAERYDDAQARALYWLTCRLVDAEPAPAELEAPHLHGIRTERTWLGLIQRAPVRALFDLAMCPDHPLWLTTFDNFVLPLGLLLAQELWQSGEMVMVHDLFQQGAYPDHHPNVVYERRFKRPAWTTDPDPTDPRTWFGFDAVELTDDGGVAAYHWLGFEWHAPLIFQQTRQHAYRSLDHLEQSWQLVRDSVSGDVWDEIERCQRAGYCRHVIVHDRSTSMFMPSHLERAIAHYGVPIEVMDVIAA